MDRLRQFASVRGWKVEAVVEEIGSGLNGRRKKLLKLLSNPSTRVILVEHRDRLTRFGFEFIEAALASEGRQIMVADETEKMIDIWQDFVDVVTSMCARIYGRRGAGYRAKKAMTAVRGKRTMTKNIRRGYRTELAPNKDQRELLAKHAGAARFVWNWGLERRINEYKKMGRSRGAIEQHRQLNALKATNYPWMYEVSKCSPQESLRDLDKAFANFFRRVKQKKEGKFIGKVGFPKFKSRRKGLGSFRLTGAIHVEEKQIKLPRIGWVNLKERGYLPTNGANILSATVSERAGRWFVSVQVEENIEVELATGLQVGVDLGIKMVAVCSDGKVFENPKALRGNERKLARLQRRMCRQQKGSNRRNRTKKQVARLHLRISNIRSDAIHKATSSIVARTKPQKERPSSIVIEDLNASGMLKNRRLSKSISDASFGEFRRQFEYKCLWSGINLIIADRFYPSSKTCSECGTVKPQLELSERKFVCESCGCVLDRDLNASLNLKALAGSSPERINGRGENVRPVVEDGQISMKRQPEMCHMS